MFAGDLIAGVQLTAYGSHWMTQWHPEHTVGQFSLPSILQCEAPKIAKLVNITPITMVYR